MSVLNWSPIADDNGNSDPTISWVEGQMPSTVNDSARSMMAAIAAYLADAGGALVSAGSSNNYTLTTTMGVTALTSPLTLMFKADRANSGAPTLSVDMLAAKPMVNQGGGTISAGEIIEDGVYFAVYDETADSFFLMNLSTVVAAHLGQAAEATVASAGTANILGAASLFIAISGTTTITSFGTGANRWRMVRATGAFQITHNASSLICPTGANITTAAGDTFLVTSDASSNARILAYQRASGVPLALADGSVTTAKIPDGAVTLAKLAVSVVPTPTSSTMPVGWAGYAIRTSSGTTASNATTSGANIGVSYLIETSGNWEVGATQTGTWQNISGVTLAQYDMGLWKRTA
jgi:hypothetical protein